MTKTKKKAVRHSSPQTVEKKTTRISDVPRQRITSAASLRLRSYDAAAITRHNENHWLYADGSDADYWIRQDLATVRNRARYEIKNNSYAEGIIDTLVTEIIGDGPDLQFDSGEGKNADDEIEIKFYQWTQNCDIEDKQTFGEMLQLVGVRQQCDSGEGLLAFANARPQRDWTRVSREPLLRLRTIEPDRLASPFGLTAGGLNDEKIRDGIEYDEDGRPAFYYILKQHPGSATNFGAFGEYDKIPASQIIHLYRMKRPGQSRGMPWITPALSLFAQLRRFTLATLQNAETAANTTGAIETDAGSTEVDAVDAGDEVEIPRNSWLTLPAGSKLNQPEPKHPATTYEMFKAEIINEIARCVNMPYNIAAANSSKYNYASGRMDHQSFRKFKKVIRGWLERRRINRVLTAWLREGLLVPGFFKFYKGTNLATTIPQWNWPGDEHVDPSKESKAQDTQLSNLSTNLKTEYAAKGKDWEVEVRQAKKEKDLCEELGMPWPGAKKAKPEKQNKENEDETEETEQD